MAVALCLVVFALMGIGGDVWAQDEPDQSVPLIVFVAGQGRTDVSGEVVAGKGIELEAYASIVFVTGTATYAALKPEVAPLLVLDPTMDSPPGLRSELLALEATPAQVSLAPDLTAEGFKFHCKIRVHAEQGVVTGVHSVIVSLPVVAEVAKRIKAISPSAPLEFHFNLTVYESEQARDAARLEREAAARRAEEAEAARKHRNIILAVTTVGILIIAICIVAYVRPWIAPKYRLDVIGSRPVSTTGLVKRKHYIDEKDIDSPPTPLIERYPGRSFWGKQVGVEVELVSLAAEHRVDKETTERYEDGRHVSTSIAYFATTKYQVRITATASAGIGPLSCVARTPAGSLRVRVR